MAKKEYRILGINPGTRYLGLAIILGPELLDWRIKAFNGKWTKEKARSILEVIKKQVDLYDINTISLKKLHPSRTSRNLKYLISNIKALARKLRIKVYQFSIKELEKFSLDDEKLNKWNLIKAIVKLYPLLYHEGNKERSRKNGYRYRMFEAVGLASSYYLYKRQLKN